jgi:hypothetical protein
VSVTSNHGFFINQTIVHRKYVFRVVGLQLMMIMAHHELYLIPSLIVGQMWLVLVLSENGVVFKHTLPLKIRCVLAGNPPHIYRKGWSS